ncbi:wax ester/triacylglycerol synthase family O-acyltransferase [Roseiarcus sp.]|uniref:WS/DGAT/MGAT family O-acyltransferase n=1 Tax=Roseiarcus sp. TaxID=1969460 RepID=UPI003F9C37BE
MKRLSALDALFLYMETPETPMHVASLTIFKPERPSDDLFARFRAHTAARLDLLPSYRRRLEPTPLGLDHPVWIVEDKVDLDYHIRHEALPKPGGMAELRALIGQLHAVPLDRKRPLWEYHFIEGLEDGSFAVYVKVHHSAMDGLAGMATLGVTFDFSPDAEHERLPPRTVPPDAEPNDFIEMTSTAIGDFIRQGWRTVKALPGAARALTKAAPNLSRDARFLYRYLSEMPRTPFNRAISAHRVYATSSLPFPEVKALAKSRGVTVNDIVLALCAGALRRYLVEHAALPAKGLAVGVPASIRPLGNAQLNNQVVFTLSRLPTEVAEPLPRLAAAQAAGQEAKNLFADMRELVTTDISILAAPLIVMGLTRLWAAARGANYLWPFFNLVISNVPGPRKPLYCVGAPATHYFPISIPYHGCALNVTVQSYLDQLDFGLIACSEAVPDAQRIADFIVEDFAALKAADAEFARPDIVEKIALTLEAKPAATHRPIALGEAKPPQAPRPLKAEKATALTRQVDALATATETLRSRLAAKAATPEQTRPEPAEKKPAAVKAKAGAKRPPRRVTGPAPETAPAKSPRPRRVAKAAAGKTRPRRATGKPKT